MSSPTPPPVSDVSAAAAHQAALRGLTGQTERRAAYRAAAGGSETPAGRFGFGGGLGSGPRLAGDGPWPPAAAHQSPLSAAATVEAQPRLRLVGARAIVKPQIVPATGDAIGGTTDPRWVLAVRVAEQLQGSILPPARRDRLVRMGKMFGLTAFDSNLIIAIVQDQARRGYAPAYCPTAGEPQLRMVPRPRPRGRRLLTGSKTLLVACIIAGLIAIELSLLSLVF